ncbi:putative transporter small subunit [Psychrobacter sp. DM8]|uniref:putative transporter small subunit n=1 Tax=unclassified Psychrobacter TaxID=196806 RepID=UPI003F50B390
MLVIYVIAVIHQQTGEDSMDSTFIYGLYILIWPAITLGVLVLICTATYRDIKKAQRNNKDII